MCSTRRIPVLRNCVVSAANRPRRRTVPCRSLPQGSRDDDGGDEAQDEHNIRVPVEAMTFHANSDVENALA